MAKGSLGVNVATKVEDSPVLIFNELVFNVTPGGFATEITNGEVGSLLEVHNSYVVLYFLA